MKMGLGEMGVGPGCLVDGEQRLVQDPVRRIWNAKCNLNLRISETVIVCLQGVWQEGAHSQHSECAAKPRTLSLWRRQTGLWWADRQCHLTAGDGTKRGKVYQHDKAATATHWIPAENTSTIHRETVSCALRWQAHYSQYYNYLLLINSINLKKCIWLQTLGLTNYFNPWSCIWHTFLSITSEE